MVEYLDLTEWKTKGDILNELRDQNVLCSEREWRFYVEEHNKMYCSGVRDKYIVHGPKGYKLTDNHEEIEKSIQDLKKRGLNMLWKHSQATKALGVQSNLKMDLERMEIL